MWAAVGAVQGEPNPKLYPCRVRKENVIMFKFFAGVVLGALIMAVVASTHPSQTRAALKSGTDTIGGAIVKGTTSATNFANQQLPKNTK
jgi:hypothetical protein